MTLDALLGAAQAQLAALPPCPENQATAMALATAVEWQAVRRAAERDRPSWFDWEEL